MNLCMYALFLLIQLICRYLYLTRFSLLLISENFKGYNQRDFNDLLNTLARWLHQNTFIMCLELMSQHLQQLGIDTFMLLIILMDNYKALFLYFLSILDSRYSYTNRRHHIPYNHSSEYKVTTKLSEASCTTIN